MRKQKDIPIDVLAKSVTRRRKFYQFSVKNSRLMDVPYEASAGSAKNERKGRDTAAPMMIVIVYVDLQRIAQDKLRGL